MKNIIFGTIFSLALVFTTSASVYSGTNLPGGKKKKCCNTENKDCSKGEKKECCKDGKKGKKSCDSKKESMEEKGQ